MKATVIQWSVFGQILYLLNTSDLLELESNIVVTYFDGAVILALSSSNVKAKEDLKISINQSGINDDVS